jgi:hypothetical protein
MKRKLSDIQTKSEDQVRAALWAKVDALAARLVGEFVRTQFSKHDAQ